jgi:hypothetical protein
MDISIFGYKIGLEILILMGVIFLILTSHTVCGCGNFYSLIEGMDGDMGSGQLIQDLKDKAASLNLPTTPTLTSAMTPAAPAAMPTPSAATKTNTTSTSKKGGKEGFTGANINYGESSMYNINNTPINTSSWSAQNMTVVPGQPLSAGVKAFMARPEQPIPLPEGEMLMFANTAFKPECCPNTYSTSTGCACMTGNQYNYLITRGSNNVPYSEY